MFFVNSPRNIETSSWFPLHHKAWKYKYGLCFPAAAKCAGYDVEETKLLHWWNVTELFSRTRKEERIFEIGISQKGRRITRAHKLKLDQLRVFIRKKCQELLTWTFSNRFKTKKKTLIYCNLWQKIFLEGQLRAYGVHGVLKVSAGNEYKILVQSWKFPLKINVGRIV